MLTGNRIEVGKGITRARLMALRSSALRGDSAGQEKGSKFNTDKDLGPIIWVASFTTSLFIVNIIKV